MCSAASGRAREISHTQSGLVQASRCVSECGWGRRRGFKLCLSLHWSLVSWQTTLLRVCKIVTQCCSGLMSQEPHVAMRQTGSMGTASSSVAALASTIISQLAENLPALLTASVPNIVISFPAFAQLTRPIKIDWHLEPLKEKKLVLVLF